jgi:hypothetical protein
LFGPKRFFILPSAAHGQDKRVKYFFILSLACVVFCSSGCKTVAPKPDDVAFNSLYGEIDDAGAQAFLRSGLAILEREHGPLEYPVHTVLLRHSRKNAVGKGYAIAEGFSLTEIVDAQAGIFAIYISVTPQAREFYPLLAHEIGHLKQPSLVDDWPMEGFCTVFSEVLCGRLGKDWSVWTERFSENPDEAYARAYRAAKNPTSSAE